MMVRLWTERTMKPFPSVFVVFKLFSLFMNRHQRLLSDLATVGKGRLRVTGNSMLPILKSGSTLNYVKKDDYHVGDIVFCKVSGRYIDAHKVTKKDGSGGRGWLISNNHGFDNGWTRSIFGKVVQGEYANKVYYESD